ncbi:hypothetical protein [Ketobacter nezhaii]|uniref:hypothetical protein n=1 Tax=Ketobacter sp. MCCC 1A13808 TaxID=2602738 RepID=UPI0018DB7182|nr:hypothetical protein [Ketobacter sp. MCCC 1A13808]
MTTRLKQIISLTFGLLLTVSASADIVVVVNAANPVEQLSSRELVDLYMGRNLYFPDGSLVLRLDQSPESATRITFYRELVDKSVAEVNAYWAKLLFTGRATPPQTVESAAGVLQAVQSNLNAIGYVDSEDLNGSVKVIGRVP